MSNFFGWGLRLTFNAASGSGLSPPSFGGSTSFHEGTPVGTNLGSFTISGGTPPYILHNISNTPFESDYIGGSWILAVDGPLSAGTYASTIQVTDSVGNTSSVVVTTTIGAFDLDTSLTGVVLDINPFRTHGSSSVPSVTTVTDYAQGTVFNKAGTNALAYNPTAFTGTDTVSRGAYVFTGGSSGPYLESTDTKIINYFAAPNTMQRSRWYIVVMQSDAANFGDLLCFGNTTKYFEFARGTSGQLGWLKQDDTAATAISSPSFGSAFASGDKACMTWGYTGQTYGIMYKDGLNGPSGSGYQPYGDGSWFQQGGENTGCVRFDTSATSTGTSTLMRIGARTFSTPTILTGKIARIIMLDHVPTSEVMELIGKKVRELYGTSAYPTINKIDKAFTGFQRRFVEHFDKSPLGNSGLNWFDPNTGSGLVKVEPTQQPSNSAGSDNWGAGAGHWWLDPRHASLQTFEGDVFEYTPGALGLKITQASASHQALIGTSAPASGWPYPQGGLWQTGPSYNGVGGDTSTRLAPTGSIQFGWLGWRVRCDSPSKAGTWAMFWTLAFPNNWPGTGEIDMPEVFGFCPQSQSFTLHKDENQDTGDERTPYHFDSQSGYEATVNGFHTYHVHKGETTLDFYRDYRFIGSFPVPKGYHIPHYQIAGIGSGRSVAIGGKNYLSDLSILPFRIWVDRLETWETADATLPVVSTPQAEVTTWANTFYGSRAGAPSFKLDALDNLIGSLKAISTTTRQWNDPGGLSLWDREGSFAWEGLTKTGDLTPGLWDFKRSTAMTAVGTLTNSVGFGIYGNGTSSAINTGYELGKTETVLTGDAVTTSFSGTLARGNCSQNWPGSIRTTGTNTLQGIFKLVTGGTIFNSDDGNGNIIGTQGTADISSGGTGYTSNPATYVFTPRAGVTILRSPSGAVPTRVGNVITALTFSTQLISTGIVDVTVTGGGGSGFTASLTPDAYGTINYLTGAWTLNFRTAPGVGVTCISTSYPYAGPTIRDHRVTVGITQLSSNNKPLYGCSDHYATPKTTGGVDLFETAQSSTPTLYPLGALSSANSVGILSVNRTDGAWIVYKGNDLGYAGYQNNYISGNPSTYTEGKPFWILGQNASSPQYSDSGVYFHSIGAWHYPDENRIYNALIKRFVAAVNPTWPT